MKNGGCRKIFYMTQLMMPCPCCDSIFQISQDNYFICGDCGNYGSTAEYQVPEKTEIDKLLESQILSTWERFFLKNINRKRLISKKQKLKLNEIREKIQQSA